MKIRVLDGLPLHGDNRPLKPKIVATIGNEGTYKEGVFEGRRYRKQIDLPFLVEGFYDHGVDVIRMNLSHVDVEQIPGYLNTIKKAVLELERRKPRRRPMALLADLPGPKIRFGFGGEQEKDGSLKEGGLDIELDQELRVFLEKEIPRVKVPELEGATVFLDDVPMKSSLEAIDFRWREEWIPLDDGQRLRASQDPAYHQLIENIFGIPRTLTAGAWSSFRELKDTIRRRLAAEDEVIAFVGDGDVVLEVERLESDESWGEFLRCRVLSAKTERVTGNKGFTLKGVDLDIPSFTETDRAKLRALLETDYGAPPQGWPANGWQPLVAFIGLSFAQTADDVLKAKQFIDQELERLREESKLFGFEEESTEKPEPPAIIAKVETVKGWENRHFILDAADGLMIARGDLGLQAEAEEVPKLQKTLAELCRKRGKPVITATQMLSSMSTSIEPTRAEVTDVFNAVLDGSDAVMTSDETARGRYPFQALDTMLRIVAKAETYRENRDIDEPQRRERGRRAVQDFLRDDYERIIVNETRISGIVSELAVAGAGATEVQDRILRWRSRLYREKLLKAKQQETTNSITEAACILAESRGPIAILAASTSGRTVRMLSRLRPSVAIIGAAHDLMNMRKLAVTYGAFPICIEKLPKGAGIEDIFQKCTAQVRSQEYLHVFLGTGGTVIFTAGTPIGRPGTTNQIAMRTLSLQTPP